MDTIRRIADVKSGSVRIDLPANFRAGKVEITIRSIENQDNGTESLEDLLLAAPTITDDELKKYNDVRESMSKWQLQEF